MAAKKKKNHYAPFYSRVTKIEKLFPKEFFNKMWLKVAEHEYINIFEIKFEKKNLFKNGGQNKVCDNANLC